MEKPIIYGDKNVGAIFSHERQYRYALWRMWDTNPPVMFIGLNPSTANELEPDPTITRVMGFAKAWGHGGIYMVNCFPFVSSNPDLLKPDNMIDEMKKNHELIDFFAKDCSQIIFAWGNFKIVKNEFQDVRLSKLFPGAKCLIKNKNGSPRHPLYVKGDVIPTPYL